MSVDIRHHFIHTNGIRMHVAEAGKGFPVVFCHGFPELWYSWRHQIEALAGAGFRAIAPDLRGYGRTYAPTDLKTYTQRMLLADMLGLLDMLKLQKAVFVGHDWGGAIAWGMGSWYPKRTERVVSLNTPHMPAGPEPLDDMLQAVLGLGGKPFYVKYFQEPGVAEAELEADVRTTFQKLMRPAKSAQDMWTFATVGGDGSGVLTHIGPGDSFLSDDDLAVYENSFKRTGFRGGLNWYRASRMSWEDARASNVPAKIEVPSMMITADKDIILRPEMAEPMRGFVPNLRIESIKDCGHWTQQEKPAEVNALLIDFLKDLKQKR